MLRYGPGIPTLWIEDSPMLRTTFRRTLAAVAALIVVSCASAGVAQAAGGPLGGGGPLGAVMGPVTGATAGLTQLVPQPVGALLPAGA